VRASLAVLALVALAGCGSTTRPAASRPVNALVVPRPEPIGHWTKLLLSPDGKTYLAQWSGTCEIQIAYLVPVEGGKPRALSNYERDGAESVALGWRRTLARVLLPQGQPPSYSPGVYLIDPRTHAMKLERARPREPDC
jgi:hypothetical protein